jgi:phosphohistidine phosphatase
MKLYLVRHGEAEARAIDAERPLTKNGIDQAQRLAEHFVMSGAKPSHIYHSGLVRAQQTAELIAERLGVESVKKIAHLDSSDAVGPIQNKAEYWQEDTVLVGHTPYMTELLLSLTDGRALIGFRPATGVCLDKQEDGRWMREWVFENH